MARLTLPLRVLVVDDEPQAREGLAALLRRIRDVDVAAPCGSGREAVQLVRQLRPEVVMLDIQLPDISGFEVIKRIGVTDMPVTVFVTAYDDFAVQAFDVHAADYLLKPIAPARVQAAITRARERVHADGYRRRFARMLRALGADERVAPRRDDTRFVVTTGTRVTVLEARDVVWIEAARYYARLHSGGRAYLIRETMTSLAGRLHPATFMRIHRSCIVNLAGIRQIERRRGGSHVASLADGTRVPVARTRLRAVLAALGRADSPITES